MDRDGGVAEEVQIPRDEREGEEGEGGDAGAGEDGSQEFGEEAAVVVQEAGEAAGDPDGIRVRNVGCCRFMEDGEGSWLGESGV